MFWIIGLLLCLTFSPAPVLAATGSAAVDTWYLRPVGACANNGDGLAYDCAASGGATGAFIGVANLIWTTTTGIDDGDTLYICGTLEGDASLVPTAAGSASAPIIINFDCPGDPGKLSKLTTMTEATTAGNWTNESGSLWYLSLAGYTWKDPRRIWLNDVELFPSNSKANLGTRIGSPSAPLSVSWFDSGNSRLYLYSTANPATGLVSLKSLVGVGAADYAALRFPSNSTDFYTVLNPKVEGGNLTALYVIGADFITIQGANANDSRCVIGERSAKGIRVTDANANGTGDLATDVLIQDCTIDPVVPDQFRGYDWEWNAGGLGDGIEIMGGTTSVRVVSNTINGWPHTNLSINALTGTTAITASLIKGNTFTCTMNTAYCRGFAVDGATAGRVTNNWIVSNTFTGFHTRSQFNGNGNFLIGNLFTDMKEDTVYSQGRNEMLQFQPYGGYSDGNTVAQNTFSGNPYAPCIAFLHDAAGTVQNHVVVNNVLHNCGGTYLTGKENVALSLPTGTGIGDQIIRNNDIFNTSRAAVMFYKGTGLTTVAGFQAACSGDTCTGNLETNPLFVGESNFGSQAASPLRRAGVWWGNECADVRGRPCFVPPDIGAYQSGSGDDSGVRTAR